MSVKYCIKCDMEYPNARHQLGYRTCLSCGDLDATKIANQKSKQTAPLFNKGAYQYIPSLSQTKFIGR